jgi:hypothetical protein
MVVLLPSTVKFECNSGRNQARTVDLDLVIVLYPGGNDCDDGQEDSEEDQRGNREPSIMHACSAATLAPRFDSRMMHGLNKGVQASAQDLTLRWNFLANSGVQSSQTRVPERSKFPWHSRWQVVVRPIHKSTLLR